MGYTRQLGQLAYLITFDGSGNITVPASLTQGSVTSSMLKADAGGKLVAAVAGTDFVAPAGLSAYVPTTRTLTINGTSYDLSADRSWTIVSGVSSFNTRTGAITLLDTDVTGALGYTPVTNARTLTINGTTYDLSANRSWSIVAGISSFNTRTGDITLLDTDVTGALGYTPVNNARTITINGTTYDLSANRTWVVDASSVTTRVIQKFTATSSQTTFTITGGYTVGMVDVFLNGIKLDNATEFTASNGSTVVLALGAATGDIVEVYKYGGQFIANNTLRQSTLFTATAGQTTFTVNYSVGFVDVFYNGSKLDSSEFTATNGTSIVLGTACVLNDKVEVVAYNYTVGAFTGVGGSGTTGTIAKWTATGTMNNSIITESGSAISVSGTVNATGGYILNTSQSVTTSGSIGYNNAVGVFIYGRTGSEADFRLYNAGGLTAMSVVAGTQNVSFNARIGINTSSPGYRLHLLGGDEVGSRFIVTGTYAPIQFSGDNSTTLGAINAYSGIIAIGRGTSTGINPDIRIDSSGNVGIGVTPATFNTIGPVLQIGRAAFYGYLNEATLGANFRYESGDKYINSDFASLYQQKNGTHVFSTAPSGSAGAAMALTGQMIITNAGQILKPSQPAFLVYGNNNGAFNTVTGDYLIYPTTHLNRGNHYNTSNGIFTAPIAGVYYFSWSTIGGNDNEVYRSFIRVNNVTFLGDYHLRQDTGATGSEYGTNGNRCVILNLAANDTVRIFFKTDTNNSMYGRGATTDPYHNFMGYLIG